MQFRATPEGLLLAVKVRPKTTARAPKTLRDQDDRLVVEIAVNAPPEHGLANKAVIALLAKALAMSKTDVILQTGSAARHKIFLLKGDAAELTRRIESWLNPPGDRPNA